LHSPRILILLFIYFLVGQEALWLPMVAMGRAGLEPALLYQELGPKPSAYANFATCPLGFFGL
jgi:hypothetical protein